MRVRHFFVAVVASISAAHADFTAGMNLLQCRNISGELNLSLSDCKLEEQLLASPEQNADSEFDFLVEYIFSCHGDHTNIGVATDLEFAPLTKTDIPITLSVRGSGALRLSDQTPSRTKKAVFYAGCSLSIENVSRSLVSRKKPLQIDLISTANCELHGERLRKCKFVSTSIEADGTKSLDIPLKSVLRVVAIGRCSAKNAVSVRAKSKKDNSHVELLGDRPNQAILRAIDRSNIERVSLSANSVWPLNAHFDSSCRTHLEVQLDVLDVSSTTEALSLIRQQAQLIRDKHTADSALSNVSSYRGAASVLYHLSNNVIRQLRCFCNLYQ